MPKLSPLERAQKRETFLLSNLEACMDVLKEEPDLQCLSGDAYMRSLDIVRQQGMHIALLCTRLGEVRGHREILEAEGRKDENDA